MMMNFLSTILTFSLGVTAVYIAGITIASLVIEKRDDIPKSVAAGMMATTGSKVLNRLNMILLGVRSTFNNFLIGVNLRKSNATTLKLEYQKQRNQNKYEYLSSEEHDSFVDSYALAHPDFIGTLQTLLVSTTGSDFKEDVSLKEEHKQELKKCVADEKARDAELKSKIDKKIKEDYPIATQKEYKALRNELYHKMQQSNPTVNKVGNSDSLAYKVGQKTNQLATTAISASQDLINNATKNSSSQSLSWNTGEDVSSEISNPIQVEEDKPIKDLSTNDNTKPYDPVEALRLEQSGKVHLSTTSEYKREVPKDIDTISYEDEFGKPLTLEEEITQDLPMNEKPAPTLFKSDDNYKQSDTGVWCLVENEEEIKEEII